MKKSFAKLFLLLPLAFSMSLAGCKEKGKSSSSSSGSTSSEVASSSSEGGSTSQGSSTSEGGSTSHGSGTSEGESSSSEEQAKITSYSFAEVVAAFAAAGIENVIIPDYHGEDLAVSASGATFQIGGSSAEEMAAFVSSCLTAGWVLEQDTYGDYSGKFGETLASIYIGNYLGIDGYDCIIVSFSIAPASEFPGAEIAADLAALGVTDTIPAYSGADASGFSWYCAEDGIQLCITFEGDIEEIVLSAYQADLLAASYTEAGVDSYGDMHYASPNSQLDLVVWRGSDIGYSGYIFVDVEVL